MRQKVDTATEIAPEATADESQPSPAVLVRRILGVKRLSQLCDRTSGAIFKWDFPLSKGGKGGLVPDVFQARILQVAEAEGLPITARDLIAEPVQ